MSAKPPDGWLVPAPPQLLEPDDAFHGLDAVVSDFWRWAFSDLRDNTVRGVLAEFIVAAALGRTATRRKGWDNYDVQSDSGVKVEVKASGYLQSWAQAKHSRLDFGRIAAPGKRSGRVRDEITIYKAMGHVIEDMVAADMAVRAARRDGMGQVLQM